MATDAERGRYIVDDFTRTFGTTEVVPEPGTLLLLALGLAGMGARHCRQPKP